MLQVHDCKGAMAPAPSAAAAPVVRTDRAGPPSRIVRSERSGPGRHRLERFVQRAFFAAYGAHVRTWSPTLVGFEADGGLLAVAGLRLAAYGPLFSEQYLDEPVQRLIARHTGAPVDRRRVIEVGNLALTEPGHARWLIGAVTLLLHAAGHEHVVFTAVRPLVNAFARIGLAPVVFGAADPRRLSDGGRRWGRYYDASPVVCAGDIAGGHRHLQARLAVSTPSWAQFWRQAQEVGAGLGPASASGMAAIP